jgi:hypothetical protein
MNKRLEQFENIITKPDGSVNDLFSEKQRDANELEKLISMNPQQAYQLSTSIKAQHDSLKKGIQTMRQSFVNSCSEALKDKPDPAKLRPFQNVLPYGLSKETLNPNRPPAPQDINAGLEDLDPTLTNQVHQTYTRIFHKMFPDTYKDIKDEIFEGYGNTSIRETEVEQQCLNNIFHSGIGSMFDWPSIDPKSIGLGNIEHISDLFQKYYIGEVDDEKNPFIEKDTGARKYVGGDELDIQGTEFYNDFINGFFFRHCVKGFLSKDTTGPTDFKRKVDGFYNFNPDLWFNNKDTDGTFKHSDASTDFDSYGNFFKVKQPIRAWDAYDVENAAGNPDPRDRANYNAGTILWETAVNHVEVITADVPTTIIRSRLTGMYNTTNAKNSLILTNEDKKLCCLFHRSSISKRSRVRALVFAQRFRIPPVLEDFDFSGAYSNNFGNGTDRGPDGVDSWLVQAGQEANDEINTVAQLLYNSESIGFHITHGYVNGHNANGGSRISLRNNAVGNNDIQVITRVSCGINHHNGNFQYIHNVNGIQYSNGNNPVVLRDSASVNLSLLDTIPNTIQSFRKNAYQFIDHTTFLRGGNPQKKKSKHSQIKKISKAKITKKENKKDPVRKVKYTIQQKGGALGNLFDIRTESQNGNLRALDASRREYTITRSIFENYRKSIKEYVKKFRDTDSTAKIQKMILDKFNGMNHFGVFYHGPEDILNFGGEGTPATGGPANNIKFEEIGEMFLFCSVITNTIKLMIHFFENINHCIRHFIKTQLEDIRTHINKALKSVNTTSISSMSASYFEKYIDGCNNLISNIEKLIEFLRNNTMCLGKPVGFSDNPTTTCLSKDEQLVMNLFFGANVSHQSSNKDANGCSTAQYPIQFYTFHHNLIDFFSINSNHNFNKINPLKFQRALRILSCGDIILNNGFAIPDPTTYPNKEYSQTNVSLGGIPLTFIDSKATQFAWMTFGFLLTFREKANEQLEKDNLLEINQSLSQISSKEKLEIKTKVFEAYKGIRPIIADPKIDIGSKNKLIQKIFFSFFEESNAVAKRIMDDHSEMEKKSKRINIRNKTTITNIVQRRGINPAESGRILVIKEIEIQHEIRKFSYRVESFINLLHSMIISGPHGSMKNYVIFMYMISRLRNFVYRLYYFNKSYYIENEETKKKVLAESGFSLSKTPNKKTNDALFKKMLDTQLKDQSSHTQEWWELMEVSFRKRTSLYGKYFRLFVFVLMDKEAFLVDIFSMAKSVHSIKSYTDILKETIVYKDREGHDIYSPENMLIKLETDFSKDTNYRKLLSGNLYYEYMKDGSRYKKKVLEPIFIQGSTLTELEHILKANFYVPPTGRTPENFIISAKSESSLQIYRIQKHFVLHASAFRSWAYDLLFSMPSRIDVDNSYFKLHIQMPIMSIPPLAKTQILPSLKTISFLNQKEPIIKFKSEVKLNNNSKFLMNTVNNKKIKSYAKYISREQIILLGLVFGDSLH